MGFEVYMVKEKMGKPEKPLKGKFSLYKFTPRYHG